jgi:glycosyltransferase involved in cell wall biosynthesis
MTLLGGVAVLIAAHQSRGDPTFLIVLLPLAALEPILIIALHDSVIQVIQEVDLAMAVILLALASIYVHQERALHRAVAPPPNEQGVRLGRRLSVESQIQGDPPGNASKTRPMRILILSWRCPHNPRAGGAERFTHEVAERLVAHGHSVEWFSSKFANASAEDEIDGIRIVRAGSWLSVYWHAFIRYRETLRDNFDAVIDEVNVLPFFAHVWAGVPTHVLIFQLHRGVWWYQAPLPLAAVGYLLEPLYMRACRRIPALTISSSTEGDLRRLGYRSRITVLPIGVERMAMPPAEKAIPTTFAYVGRLVRAKRIEHILEAFALYRNALGSGTLWLVGTGADKYQRSLRYLIKRLGIEDNVRFWGHTSSLDKHRLMAEAHALLMTSVREGWGLVITEANACGTPAIVYDVHGLRDAVRHESTGLVVPARPDKLAEAMIRLTNDQELYSRLVTEGRRWSATFSFDETARALERALQYTTARP